MWRYEINISSKYTEFYHGLFSTLFRKTCSDSSVMVAIMEQRNSIKSKSFFFPFLEREQYISFYTTTTFTSLYKKHYTKHYVIQNIKMNNNIKDIA